MPKQHAGYLTKAELDHLVRDEDYASEQHCYYGRDPEITVRVWGDEKGLWFEAKRKGKSKPEDSGLLDGEALRVWFGDVGTVDWARA